MIETPKPTFTFTCDPSKWTVAEWGVFCDYFKDGSLAVAARLARMGVRLERDSTTEPAESVECIGWAPVDANHVNTDELSDSVDECCADYVGDVLEVTRVYRGVTEYAVAYGIGDEDENYEGTECAIFSDPDKAQKFADSLQAVETA